MSEKTQDTWKIALEEKKSELQLCQEKQEVESCMKCSKLIGCELREAYVKAVYDSMNKGTGGGFEF